MVAPSCRTYPRPLRFGLSGESRGGTKCEREALHGVVEELLDPRKEAGQRAADVLRDVPVVHLLDLHDVEAGFRVVRLRVLPEVVERMLREEPDVRGVLERIRVFVVRDLDDHGREWLRD